MSRSPLWLVVGGGFIGLYLSEHLARRGQRVLVVEKGQRPMGRASYSNQARVHHGYHYPRSVLTAYRSKVNYPRFTQEFQDCVVDDFEKLYAIGRRFSKVSAAQFRGFMERIGAPIQQASSTSRSLFDPAFVEDVFETQECAFDASALARAMSARVEAAGVRVRLQTEAVSLRACDAGLEVTLRSPAGEETLEVGEVLNCTYSGLNRPLATSGLPSVPLKHELTELCLVEVPEPVRRRGITVMCGPFFSCMPFPPRGLHSLSHVRYTPHFAWRDRDGESPYDPAQILAEAEKRTSFPHMVRDAARYMPILRECRYEDSLWEVKTVMPRSEANDSRPILFRRDVGLDGLHLVLGGKIDNVYDAVSILDEWRGWT